MEMEVERADQQHPHWQTQVHNILDFSYLSYDVTNVNQLYNRQLVKLVKENTAIITKDQAVNIISALLKHRASGLEKLSYHIVTCIKVAKLLSDHCLSKYGKFTNVVYNKIKDTEAQLKEYLNSSPTLTDPPITKKGTCSPRDFTKIQQNLIVCYEILRIQNRSSKIYLRARYELRKNPLIHIK
jgi:hypothetical protein